MLKKILCLSLTLSFAACASAPVAQKGPFKPKPFVTPYEYYSHARPAVLTDQDDRTVKKTEYSSTGEDTKEDHHQAIIIGTLVGVTVVGGAVAGILIAK